jgi:DNA-binding NarL/FixJ family response regulator
MRRTRSETRLNSNESPRPRERTPWPLVGRQNELAVIARSIAGEGNVLLAGGAGVGKSRIASEGLARAAAAGYPTTHVRASRSASGLPFGAFAAVLPPSDASSHNPTAMIRHAVDALVAIGGDQQRHVILIDDAHALDELSAMLLLQLAARPELCLLITVRTDEPMPEPLTTLWKDDLAERLEVEPLVPLDVFHLLRELLSGAIAADATGALWQASRGNALYLRELVSDALDRGAIAEVEGIWYLRGSLEASPRLAELVESRLGALSAGEREVLELVAIGEPLGVDDIEALADPRFLETLQRRAIVDIEREGHRLTVRLAHPIYGEVLRRGIPALRHRAVCRALADEVEKRGRRRRGDLLRVAVWRLEGGGVPDADLLLAAARQADYAADYALAERLARAAWDAAGLVEAGHLLGKTLDTLGDHRGAEAVLEAAAGAASTEQERTLVALARSDNLFRGLGDPAAAEEVALAVETTLTDEGLRGELTATRAIFRLFSGRLADTMELAGPLLERRGDRAFAQGALPAATALALAGRTAEAIDVADRAFAARINLGDQVQMAHPGVHLVARAMGLCEAGRLLEAHGTAQAALDAVIIAGDRPAQAWFTAALARCTSYEGTLNLAAYWSRQQIVLWGELNHPNARWGYGGLASALAQLGDVDGADTALADLDAEASTPVRMMDIEIDRARAWAAAARGAVGRAKSMLLDTAAHARALGQFALAAGALHDVVRLGGAADAVDALDALVDRVDGALMDARVMHAHAAVNDDARGLDRAADAFDALGAHLWAAEASSQAAVAYRRAGDPRRASAAHGRAQARAAACGSPAPATPALAFGTEAAVLTAREREVATLAVTGATNREIASQLFVSARTVENHLQRAYEKLGIRSRAELGDALGPFVG